MGFFLGVVSGVTTFLTGDTTFLTTLILSGVSFGTTIFSFFGGIILAVRCGLLESGHASL